MDLAGAGLDEHRAEILAEFGIDEDENQASTMITLYQFQTSPLCEKVRRILDDKKLGFEIHEVPRARVAATST